MAGFSLVPSCLIDRQSEKYIGEMIRGNRLCGSPSDHLCLVHLHYIAAADPLTVKFLLDARCDLELCCVPEAIHLTGEVFGELG